MKAVEFCETVFDANFYLIKPFNLNSTSGMCSALCFDPGLELIQVVKQEGDVSMFSRDPNGKRMFESIRDARPVSSVSFLILTELRRPKIRLQPTESILLSCMTSPRIS